MCEFYSSAYKTINLFVKCIRVNAYCSLAVFIANYRRCPRRDVSAIVMCLQDHGFESWSRCLVHQCYISGINGDHYLNYEVCPARCTPKTACCFLLQTKPVCGKQTSNKRGSLLNDVTHLEVERRQYWRRAHPFVTICIEGKKGGMGVEEM